MASIELPRDAEGREIPLDTKVLYEKKGTSRKVWHFDFRPNCGDNGLWTVVLENKGEKVTSIMYLKPPDSWAKLEEDIDRCIEGNTTCRYFSEEGSCCGCPAYDDPSCCCTSTVFKDIKKRIRNLNGENHDC